MKVGFIGVGNVGGPMCRNIIAHTNHEVVVFDLNVAAVALCTGLGAARALASPTWRSAATRSSTAGSLKR